MALITPFAVFTCWHVPHAKQHRMVVTHACCFDHADSKQPVGMGADKEWLALTVE